MKILVIQQKMIGDVLVSSIICNNLRKAYPEAQIDYLVYESTKTVLEGNTAIDRIIYFEAKHRNSFTAFMRFVWGIRSEKYDLIIDAYSKLESWLIVLLSGSKRRISYKKRGREFLYTDNVPFALYPKTNMGLAIERRLSLLQPLCLNIKIDPMPKLFVTKAEQDAAQALLEKHHVDRRKKTVMISLLGSEDIKTYPLPFMAIVVDQIAQKADVNILFNYFPSQVVKAKQIFDACLPSTQKQIYFDVLGHDLRSFIGLMDACDIIIGNDGGSINMAKALNKPSFIIFSPWIEQKIWATFEDGLYHQSVHLKEFFFDLFEGKSEKELKNKALDLYQDFSPALFETKLSSFLEATLELQSPPNTLEINPIRLQISALIITYNEEKHLQSVLEDLDFADEIIVVDSFSTDKTAQIVTNFPNATFVQHAFVDYSSQRNFAISCAKNNWILFLDADERFTPALKDEVIATIQGKKPKSAYFFYRTFMFQEQELHYSGWQTDKIFRLFQKDKAQYTTVRLVHEKLLVQGPIGKLKHKLIHFSYTSYQSYKDKMVSYGKLKAREKTNSGMWATPFHLYLHPAYKFLYQYLIRLGFLDGKKGLIICYLNALSVYVRYEELRKKGKS